MRVVFLLNYPGYTRYFDVVIWGLLERGHSVHVTFEANNRQIEGLEALEPPHPNLTVDLNDFPRRWDKWRGFARGLRGTTDYIRYLDPLYKNSPYLRNRTAKALPERMRLFARMRPLPRWMVKLLRRSLVLVERAIPSADNVEDFLRQEKPDVLLVSPLVNVRSWQTDAVKSAKALGIPTGLCVASWDHLTTKGLIRVKPDRVFVWNPIQKREAIELHDIPARKVTVTGAQPFDKWFERRPALSREEFCSRVGFPDARPFVLFVGSTSSISKPEAEVEFVQRWLAELRSAGGPLAEAGVLIRPHPYNCEHWKTADVGADSRIVVYPRGSANPVNESDRSDYYHSLYYCEAVIGINTSAMVESTILGKPVLTVLDSTFDETQKGTLHFQYLLPENSGFLMVGKSLREHVAQLNQILQDPEPQRARTAAFVDNFVRPCGRTTNAANLLIEAIEELGRVQPSRVTNERSLVCPDAGVEFDHGKQ